MDCVDAKVTSLVQLHIIKKTFLSVSYPLCENIFRTSASPFITVFRYNSLLFLYMAKPLRPLFLYFPGYFCHFHHLSDFLIPYLVELCDSTYLSILFFATPNFYSSAFFVAHVATPSLLVARFFLKFHVLVGIEL